MNKIYTASYNLLGSIDRSDFTLVDISGHQPFTTKCDFEFKELFPSNKLLNDHSVGLVTHEEFRDKYIESISKKISARNVVRTFNLLYKKYKKPVLLMSYGLYNPLNYRAILSDWIRFKLNIEIPEYHL